MFMPIDFLLHLLTSLICVVLPGSGVYILYQWYNGELISDRWLFLAAGLLLWSFLGFLPLLLLRRAGRDEPKPLRSDRAISNFQIWFDRSASTASASVGVSLAVKTTFIVPRSSFIVS